ncbi:MAG: hypothetical protein AB1405_10360 [Bdellovibrionota bacterium]
MSEEVSKPYPTAALVRDALARGPGVWVKVASSSMAPAVQAGEEVWVEALAQTPRPGEILLYEGPAGLTLHRLVYLRHKNGKKIVRTKGDSAKALDPLFPLDTVVGKATRVRNGTGERSLGRRGGIAGSLVSIGQAAIRKVLASLDEKSWRPVELAGFPVFVRLGEGVSWKLAGQWLEAGRASPRPIRLEISLDPSLHQGDPFEFHVEGPKIRTSAFCLERKGSAFSLRVAPSARNPGDVCPNALENGLRALLLSLCEETEGAFLFHGTAASSSGNAFVAVGPSGCGKTTLARLLKEEGWQILGDDLVLARKTPDGPQVSSTGFTGGGKDIPLWKGPAKIRAFFVLEKAETHTLSPASPARLAAALAAQLQRLPGHRSERDLAHAEELARMVPGFSLAFAKKPGVGHSIEQALRLGG